MKTKEIGEKGEQAVCRYLEDKDYEILEQNFRTATGEIDIIAQDGECIVFVEVKTRRNNSYGEPSEAVNYRKQKKIIKTAMCYTDTVNNEIRFDVAEVFYRPCGEEIEVISINYIENAF